MPSARRSGPGTRRWKGRILGAFLAAALMPLVSCSSTGKADRPPAVVGLADFHNHQFAHLGFGGSFLTHEHDPGTACVTPPGFDASTFKIRDLVRQGLYGEADQYARSGNCAVTFSNKVSQRVDTDSLKRAWRYGLRLMVMLAESSEYLCQYAALATPCPSDRQALDAQIQAARDFEAKIEAEDGGWYQIVESPDEARRVIGDGKLAVVLGIEAANAFGCYTGFRANVQGVAPLFGSPNNEVALELRCGISAATGFDDFGMQEALALFEHYWDLGVRHFFPIHNFDGVAGGTALSIPLLHASTNPSQLADGGVLNRVPDIDRTLVALRPSIEARTCSDMEFDGGRCNNKGLTATGRELIRLMADRGAIVDIDHMSRLAKNQLLASDGGLLGGAYPVVSSHSGILEINHGSKRNEGQLSSADLDAITRSGGAVAPILVPASSVAEEDTFPTPPADDPETEADESTSVVAKHQCGGTSETFVQAYRFAVNKLRAGRMVNGEPTHVGVGIGSDFHAPISMPAPRFVPSGSVIATSSSRGFLGFGTFLEGLLGPALVGPSKEPRPGFCYQLTGAGPRVSYPFTSPKLPGAGSFDRSTLPWTGLGRSYDISVDGVAHVGMIPDFVEELRVLGLTAEDLEPLWQGAEAYIRAWEASESWEGSFSREHAAGTRAVCAQRRSQLTAMPSGLSTVDDVAVDALRQPIETSRDSYRTLNSWRSALADLKSFGCHGFPSTGFSTSTTSAP